MRSDKNAMKKTSQRSLLFRQNVNRTEDVLWGLSLVIVSKIYTFYTSTRLESKMGENDA